ncbi:MAG TPA: hypothetical protein VKI61_03165 [Chitinophagaceae bacterium]|jgi:hypothetical protein|nr:hypothetical protein [Chitinophagaceae bacterium]
MVGAQGQETWLIQKYISIIPKTNVKMNAFADKDEKPQLPGFDGDYHFSEQNGITKMRIAIFNESLEPMERLIETGFKEGFKIANDNLEKLLATLSKRVAMQYGIDARH